MQKMKLLLTAGLLATTVVAGTALPGRAEDKMKVQPMGGKMAPKMSGGKMTGGKMTGGKMTGSKMTGSKMSDGKMAGDKMMSCPACKMMNSTMSPMDKKEIAHMASMMSASEKKTYNAMSASEKALLMKAMKASLMHGKTMGKM